MRIYREFASQLPERLDRVLDYAPALATRVYSADGELIGEFFLQRRILVPLARIPAHVQQAFVSAEDRRFRQHVGFDPIGIGRAAYENYIQGGVRQGASTITQQVARMLMLTQEKTVARKIKELILSVRVERELSKDQILYIYLNHVYLGHGAYGVQAAAEAYFGKDVEHLTVAEAAMLAGLPKAPTKFSPYNDYHRARERQAYVLTRMYDDKVIDEKALRDARQEPMALVAREQPISSIAAPYFVEHIRKWASARFGDRGLFDAGLRIYTTLDMSKQRTAEAAVRAGLAALDRRLGFRGPIGRLSGAEQEAFVSGPPRPFVATPDGGFYAGGAILPEVPYVGVVIEIKEKRRQIVVDVGPLALKVTEQDAGRMLRWRRRLPKKPVERLEVGDLVPVTVVRDEKKGDLAALAQVPDVQAALVAIDPATGDVVSMVGGYDYRLSVFNRATQARRQTGSSIKPFIYAAALEAGYTPLSIVVDAPVAVRTLTGVWTPSNYKAEFLGPMTLKTALAKSINTVSVRLVAGMGVEPVIKMMRRLGVRGEIPRHISISLGTPDISLLEMTAAYSSFPAGGRLVVPRFITKVTTDDGRILPGEDRRALPPPKQALSPEIAYLMVDLMKGVVLKGTAKRALELGRPAAGKTGTSTGFRDAWFIGYTTELACGIWVGRDNFTPIGHDTTGGSTALPIWVAYMKIAHPPTPPRDFPPPPDVTFVRASDVTGSPVAPGAPGASWVPFARGTIPPQFTSRIDAAQFSQSASFGEKRPPR